MPASLVNAAASDPFRVLTRDIEICGDFMLNEDWCGGEAEKLKKTHTVHGYLVDEIGLFICVGLSTLSLSVAVSLPVGWLSTMSCHC